ncbi:MAG TPA: FtsW/RodA/SpoVE family cell cycle protein [Victivallales bacterium]|nr:FtsW/RodA/SpoVE family cell cycle protein [Victivallales bacterium]
MNDNSKSGILDSNIISIGIIVFLIGICGCFAIYNSTFDNQNSTYFALKQLVWLVIGIGIYFITANIPFSYYKKNIILIAVATWLLLLIVLVVGKKHNGMTGWIILLNYPFTIFLQPAEIAKPVFILTMAAICYRYTSEPKKFLYLILIYIIWIIPILLEPDYGTAAVYSVGFIIIYWISDGRKAYFIILIIALIIICSAIIYFKPYVLKRIIGFLFPLEHSKSSGWHILQFRKALQHGGMTGAGLGKAFWSNTYLPLPHSDSIFASIVESAGFLLSFLIPASFVAIFAFVCYYFTKIGNKLICLFSISLAGIITFQALLHISVNIGLLPPTGITLPLISYGGSSIVSTMLSIGMIVSALEYTKIEK